MLPKRSLIELRYCSCVRRVRGASPGSGAAALHESVAPAPAVPVVTVPPAPPARPVVMPVPPPDAAPAVPACDWDDGPLTMPVQAPERAPVAAREMRQARQGLRGRTLRGANISTSVLRSRRGRVRDQAPDSWGGGDLGTEQGYVSYFKFLSASSASSARTVAARGAGLSESEGGSDLK